MGFMRFEFARMFLLPRRQGDLFAKIDVASELPDREEWLRRIFGQEVDFLHRKSDRRYVPDEHQPDADRIVARIGRKSLVQENDPDNYLHEVQRERWQACLIVIDPTSHADGQKIAIQTSSGIGQGYGNFESLVRSINARQPAEPYTIELNSITDQTSFWEYVKANEGRVTSITLEVVMPNMFGGTSSFEEDAKRLRDHEKARRIKEEIQNEDGLEPDTERMREAVSYVTRGAGRARAKAKGAPPYDSTQDKTFVDVNIDIKGMSLEQKTTIVLNSIRDTTNNIGDNDAE